VTGFLSQASFPGAVTPDWHGDTAQADGPAGVRTPPMPSVTTAYRRDAYAAQAGAATSARVRKRAYVALLVGGDLSVVALAVWGGYLARFQGGSTLTDIPYEWVGLGLISLWMLFLVWNRCYDDRVLGYGADEYRRMVSASLKLAGSVAIAGYLAN